MSYWNAKYKNKFGEYEITFASKEYEKTKAVERFCQAIIDKKINANTAADVLELLIKKSETEKHGRWLPQVMLGQRVWDCSECATLGSPHWKRCPVCEAKMDLEG